MREFIVAVVVCIYSITITMIATMKNMDAYVRDYRSAQAACEIANSDAYSFDRSEVTCENGAVMNYEDLIGE